MNEELKMVGRGSKALPKPVRALMTVGAGSLLLLGCAGHYAPPTQQMADAQSATRAANELGAQTNPKAQLHVRLAKEQIGQAKTALQEDDNESATRLLLRANADADLALALTRQAQAEQTASKAVDRSNAQSSTNMEQGAQP